MFWTEEAQTLNEQRAERRRTMQTRCEMVASVVPEDRPFIAWCHLNPEGDLLEKLIPGAVQVAGSDPDEAKEEKLDAFSSGQIQRLVTKSVIAGWGVNWPHCSDIAVFASHSWESWYQLVRRCWRFGQKRTVNVHVVTSEGESRVLANMQRKEKQAEELYDGIVKKMSPFQQNGHKQTTNLIPAEVPSWLTK
jgi:superfamily II DNA or RNA helicase